MSHQEMVDSRLVKEKMLYQLDFIFNKYFYISDLSNFFLLFLIKTKNRIGFLNFIQH
jgi:hypothetical protein